MVNDENFGKSETKIELYESKEELKNLQEYHSVLSIFIVLDDLNEMI